VKGTVLPEFLGELHVESLVVPHTDSLVLAAGHNQRLPAIKTKPVTRKGISVEAQRFFVYPHGTEGREGKRGRR